MNPGQRRPPFDPPLATVRAAADWLARLDRNLSPEETAEFMAWLRADAENRRAFVQLERVFSSFDGLKHAHAAARPDPDFFAPARRGTRWVFPSLAAAGLAAAAALAVVLWQPRAQLSPVHQYVTEAHGYQRSVLRDGSVLELNADTAVDVDFTPTERRARLMRGEAHFEIAKDNQRPFVVQAGSVIVRVVGTVFDVRVEPAAVEVLVTEGVVEVNRGPGTPGTAAAGAPLHAVGPRLVGGQKLVVSMADDTPPARIASVTDSDRARMSAWQSRITEFRRTPLAEIVAEFNRHSEGRYPRIVLADEQLASLRLGGGFRVDQPEAFVRLLENSFGVSVEHSEHAVVLRKAP